MMTETGLVQIAAAFFSMVSTIAIAYFGRKILHEVNSKASIAQMKIDALAAEVLRQRVENAAPTPERRAPLPTSVTVHPDGEVTVDLPPVKKPGEL